MDSDGPYDDGSRDWGPRDPVMELTDRLAGVLGLGLTYRPLSFEQLLVHVHGLRAERDNLSMRLGRMVSLPADAVAQIEQAIMEPNSVVVRRFLGLENRYESAEAWRARAVRELLLSWRSVPAPLMPQPQRFDNPSTRVSAVEGEPCDGGRLAGFEEFGKDS